MAAAAASCDLCADSTGVRWRCDECAVRLCCTCARIHSAAAITRRHTLDGPPLQRRFLCPIHTDDLLKFFCSNCEKALCDKCADSYEHSSHVVALLRFTICTYEESLKTSKATIERSLKEQFDDSAIDNGMKRTTLNTLFEQIVVFLNARLSHAEASFSCGGEALTPILLKEEKLFSTWSERLSRRAASFLKTKSNDDAATIGHARSASKYLFVKAQCADPFAIEREDRLLIDHVHVETLATLFDDICGERRPDVSALTVTVKGEGLRECCVDKFARSGGGCKAVFRPFRESTVSIIIKDGQTVVPVDARFVTARLSADGSSEPSDAATLQLRASAVGGVYVLSYTIGKCGSYELSVELCGHHAASSPYSVECLSASQFRIRSCTVHSPRHGASAVDDFVSQVGSAADLKNPQDLCYNARGELLVSDSQLHTVKVFDREGVCRRQIGGRGRTPGCLHRPTGVAVTPADELLVADYDNHAVSLFDSNLQFKQRFGGGRLLGPRGVALDGEQRVIVVDSKLSAVFVFSCGGAFVRRFSSRGLRPHQLAAPHYVAVNASNWLYVTDFHHHCVKVFDVSGEYLFQFGSNGASAAEFNAPTGIAVDAAQNVLVADWGNNRVQIFDKYGSFLGLVNSAKNPVGPQGLTVSPDENVAVADSGNRCCKIYRCL